MANITHEKKKESTRSFQCPMCSKCLEERLVILPVAENGRVGAAFVTVECLKCEKYFTVEARPSIEYRIIATQPEGFRHAES